MKLTIQPVILSGGAGTRLWPYSREAYPKQFIAFAGDKTLLQETVSRIEDLSGESVYDIAPPLVVCNEGHRFLVAEQLRELGFERASIILEPVGRNTAPALTLAALSAETAGSNPILVIMPSDHHIGDVAKFQQQVLKAARLAGEGALVTFGVAPSKPETGFGYIRRGEQVGEEVYAIDTFVEKPELSKAVEYMTSGRYFWNSGLFVMRAAVWLEQIARYRPDIEASCRLAFERARRDGSFIRVDKQAFSSCPSDSIDYAVMERLTPGETRVSGYVIPLDVGWSDLGSWSAVSDIQPQDARGNVIRGDVFIKDSANCLFFAQSRFLAAVGLQDLVVIETSDAVLVAHKEKAQEIKVITEHLKNSARSEHMFHAKVHRPWGNYESIDRGARYQVKRLMLKPGASLSLQRHHHRAEHWIVVKGTARVTRGEETFFLTENESTFIPLGVTHRLENPGVIPLEIVEVQSGSYLGEDDIVRFEDCYQRTDS